MAVSDNRPVRERLLIDLEKRYDKLVQVVEDAMVSVRKVSAEIQCKHCHKSGVYRVEIQNEKAAIAAAEFLTNQALGRPGITDPGEDTEKPVFIHQVIMPECSECGALGGVYKETVDGVPTIRKGERI